MLVRFECLEESPTVRELSKDLCSLFDKFREHPALIQKVVPTIVKKLGEIEPKRGKIAPPDYQEIIERIFKVSSNKWFSKKMLYERFFDSTSFQTYLRLERIRDLNKFGKKIFETEFKKYVKRNASNLMIFEDGNKFYYRQLPRGMQESDYSILKKLRSREFLDNYINLVIKPMEYDSLTTRRLDELIESILCVLGEAKGLQFERGFLRKKSRYRIFKELELRPDLRRRLNFYVRESKESPREKTIIQEISRKIILDLAREYDYVTSHVPTSMINVRELIERGENENIEFKSSMCWNYKTNKKDKLMEFSIAKAVSAFMNSEGGYLLIGVGDNKEILGLDKDFAVIRKPNKDGYKLHFAGVISKYLGKENMLYTKIFFETLDGKTIAIVKVNKSPHPVYIKHEGKEEFYIRLGNTSSPLSVSKATEYINTHWS